MDANGFLHLVWPDSGFYCIATPNKYEAYDHHVFPTIDAAAVAAESLDRLGKNVYYCMSSLIEASVIGKKGNTQYRVKTNLDRIQVFFFELDVAKPGEWEEFSEAKREQCYETREEAIQALRDFTRSIGWPQPTIVSSGWGFHVYYPLTRSIPTAEFAPVSQYLKVAAKALSFKLDRGALDLSRVFRVVGTHNWKRTDNPRPVELLKPSLAYDPDALLASLESVALELGAQKYDAQVVPDYLDFGETNTQVTYDGPPPQFEGLLECGFVKAAVEAKGNVPYQHWWHVGQVVRHVENGRAHFHELSSGSPDYDEGYTEQVLDRFENNNVGPTLCSTFDYNVGGYCDTCTHNGKIKSPIVLGRMQPTVYAENPVVEVEDESGHLVTITIPKAPFPYVRADNKVIMRSKNKDNEETEIVILDYDMFPVKRMYHESQDREHVIWKVSLPLEGVKEVAMPSADMYDKKIFTTNLVNAGIYVKHADLDYVRNYMIAYIRQLQTQVTRDNLYARLGWRENNTRFVLGDTIYGPNGGERCNVEKANRVAQAVRVDGSLDEWKKILALYDHPQFTAHLFSFATAFGAPLMAFTGISGGVINLLGTSGEGKSTVQRLVNSVWGHPLELMLPAEDGSTYNAKMGFLSGMGNLPVCAEEITEIEAKELGKLLYSITHGTDKWRMDQFGKLKLSTGLWCLTLLSSSNSSLIEKLVGTEGAAAKSLRVMELRIPRTSIYTKNEFERQFDHPLRKNFGHAGRVFAEYITRNAHEVEELVRAVMYRLDTTLNISAEERVWSAMASTNIAGFIAAQQCGLHNMDAKPLFDYAVRQIKLARDTTRDTKQTAAEALAEYLNQSMQGIIVVDEFKPEARGASTRLVNKPMKAIVGRYDRVSGQTWVATAQFKAWCVKNGRVFSDTLNELYRDRIVTNRLVLKVLGAGTEYKTGQVKCLLVDNNAEMFAGESVDITVPKVPGPTLVYDADAKKEVATIKPKLPEVSVQKNKGRPTGSKNKPKPTA